MDDKEQMTVGELKRELEGWPDDFRIRFSDGMTFYRFKKRGEKLVQMEFNELVYQDSDGNWIVSGH